MLTQMLSMSRKVEDVFAFPESGLFIEAQGDNLFIKGEGRKIALSESHIHDL